MFSFFKKKSPPPAPTPEVTLQPPTSAGAADSQAAATAAPERKSWYAKLKAGLGKTAASISGVFSGHKIDEALYEELESALLMADAGVAATQTLLDAMRRKARARG